MRCRRVINMPLIRNFMIKCSTGTFIQHQVRYLPRWSSRIPRKVHLSENDQLSNETENAEHLSEHPTTFSFQQKAFKTALKLDQPEVLTVRKAKKKKEIKTVDMLETMIDSDGNLIYKKMLDNDSRISRILSNLKPDMELRKQKSIMLEGKRLIRDALKSGCKLEYLLFSRRSDIEELKTELPKSGAHIYKMPYREMQMWSDLTTNPGIIGVFKIPVIENLVHDIPVNVICDNIREPGNLGAILRTCAAAGCKQVLLTKGCCDPWNSKVLRSAMGAHFRIQIQKLDWLEMKQQLDNTNWFIADNRAVGTNNSSLIIDLIGKIPIVNYDTISYYIDRDMTLIIGGETEGISQEAYSTVQSIGGMRLHIPLVNNCESLNTGAALAILIFEIRRQIKANT